MRLAHLRRPDGSLRLVVRRESRLVDAAAALGDERLATLSAVLGAGALGALEGLTASGGGALAEDGPLGPVLDRPGRIFCVGRNYASHRDELANAPTPWPEVFLRIDTTVTGPLDDVRAPSGVEKLDYEGELAVVIGRGGRHIPAARALDHVLGFCVANDLSARDWQWRGAQWTPGKNFDGTLPLGPELVTPDELRFDDALLETRLNGELVQSARTSQFIFDLGTQIEFLSSWAELRPGDAICTGTPGGVGAAQDPQRFLRPGDVVEVTIEGIGALRNRIIEDTTEPATTRWHDLANDGTAKR